MYQPERNAFLSHLCGEEVVGMMVFGIIIFLSHLCGEEADTG